MSKFVPNSFQVPNAFVDEVLAKISDAACKIYLVICRKTRGWHKEMDSISLTQFEEFTGKSRPTVVRCLNELMQVGLVIEQPSTIHGKTYQLGDETSLGWLVKFPSKNILLGENQSNASKKSLPQLVKIFNPTSKNILLLLVKIFNTQKTLSKNTNQKEKINKKTSGVSDQNQNGQQKEYSENFEQFWSTFPACKRKSKKSETFKTFEKYETKFNLNFLISILEKLKNSEAWSKNGGDYIPSPQAWLNQRQWENEYWNAPNNPQPTPTEPQQGLNLSAKPKGLLGGAR